jgi:hypothetical protein
MIRCVCRTSRSTSAAYIVGNPIAFAADAEAECLFVVTDGAARRSLYVCSYHFDGDDSLEQLSWSRWDFSQGSTLIGMDVLKGVLGLVFKRADGIHLEAMTLDPAEAIPSNALLLNGAIALNGTVYLNGSITL